MSLTKRIVIGLLPTLLPLAAAEAGARVLLYLRHGRNARYLIAPFGASASPAAPAEYPLKPERTYTKTDWCTGRTITFTVNQFGGRGPAWSLEKAPGRARVAIVGASTTFGVNNPDGQTWPAWLERMLRERGLEVEVLNTGVPGIRIEEIVHDLPERVLRHQPDLLLYYEAFNNATAHWDAYHQADITIGRFHRFHPIGQAAQWLHYRSMLYTTLLEKVQFEQARRANRIVPEIAYYRAQLERLVAAARSRGVRVAVVLQVTDLEPDARIAAVDLDDPRAVEQAILAATEANKRPLDEANTDQRFVTLRVYQTQALVEVARRAAQALDVPVIDPREAFARYAGDARLFCDVIHLTDEGNRLLAQTVGGALPAAALTGRGSVSASQPGADPAGS